MAKTQALSYPLRLPDGVQASALRLLDASRTAINGMLTALWPSLDAFASERTDPAWKQVDALLIERPGHGSRQERCEMEQAGRILRAQATRKQVFQTILPLLGVGLIRPAEGKRPALKDYRVIKEQVRALRTDLEDADTFTAMTNVIEQACNVYLATGAFPATYEALQPIPVQQVAQLTFAGDDGMQMGQTYRIQSEFRGVRCDVRTRAELPEGFFWRIRWRGPDGDGTWGWHHPWQDVALPEPVHRYLHQGATFLAPTLRELVDETGQRIAVMDVILEVPAQLVPPLEQELRVVGFDWGIRSLITVSVLERGEGAQPYRQISRPVFLNTGGIDGRQARLRREIDRLKAGVDRYQTLMAAAVQALDEHRTPLPAHFVRWQERVQAYQQRIGRCWQTYERRNRELAHLAANVLILLALLHDCHLICGENLTTLRTLGRGKGVRERWRNWRNNTTVRGELWRVLKYKCHLLGIRARQEYPSDTSHTCPHCGKAAQTYRSSALADRAQAVDWGAWLYCAACHWNGSRDYAASLNIARLGMVFLATYQRTQRYTAYRMTSHEVNVCLYIRQAARLLLPVQGITPRPLEGKHIHYAGWSFSTSLRTSHPQSILALLSTAALRKQVCRSA